MNCGVELVCPWAPDDPNDDAPLPPRVSAGAVSYSPHPVTLPATLGSKSSVFGRTAIVMRRCKAEILKQQVACIYMGG